MECYDPFCTHPWIAISMKRERKFLWILRLLILTYCPASFVLFFFRRNEMIWYVQGWTYFRVFVELVGCRLLVKYIIILSSTARWQQHTHRFEIRWTWWLYGLDWKGSRDIPGSCKVCLCKLFILNYHIRRNLKINDMVTFYRLL